MMMNDNNIAAVMPYMTPPPYSAIYEQSYASPIGLSSSVDIDNKRNDTIEMTTDIVPPGNIYIKLSKYY